MDHSRVEGTGFGSCDFPGGAEGKVSACNVGDLGLIPGSGRYPGILPGKFHGRRSLVGHSPWGRKESDTTERLCFLGHEDGG